MLKTIRSFAAGDPLFAKLIVNAVKLFTGSTLASLVGFATFVITARALGPSQFGVLVLASTYCAMITRLIGFQSWQAIIKFSADHLGPNGAAKLSALLRLGYVLDACAAALSFVVAALLLSSASIFFEWSDETHTASKYFVTTLIFAVTGTPTAILRIMNRFSDLAKQQVIAALFKLCLTLGAFILESSFEAYLWIWIAATIFGNLLLNAMALRALGQRSLSLFRKTRISISRVASPQLLRFFIFSNVDGVIRITRELDSQMVGWLLSAEAVGFYKIARQVTMLVNKFVDGFFQAIYPELAVLKSRANIAAFVRLCRQSALLVAGLVSLALAGSVLLGKPLIFIAFGADFETVYGLMVTLLLASLIWGFAQPVAPALMALGDLRGLLVAHAIGASVYMIALFYYCQWFGVDGTAWAFLTFQLVWGCVSIMFLKLRLNAWKSGLSSDGQEGKN